MWSIALCFSEQIAVKQSQVDKLYVSLKLSLSGVSVSRSR